MTEPRYPLLDVLVMAFLRLIHELTVTVSNWNDEYELNETGRLVHSAGSYFSSALRILIYSYYEMRTAYRHFMPINMSGKTEVEQMHAAMTNEISIFLHALILLFCMFIVLHSKMQLGKFGTHSIGAFPDHVIVRTGLYQYIRHPIYIAECLSTITYMSLLKIPMSTFFILSCIAFSVMQYKALTEELFMEETFRDGYRLYKAHTYRFIPGVKFQVSEFRF